MPFNWPGWKQDAAAISGLALLVGGVAIWSRPAAAVLLGLVLVAWAYITAQGQQ
jgi:hypothetical protein